MMNKQWNNDNAKKFVKGMNTPLKTWLKCTGSTNIATFHTYMYVCTIHAHMTV